jgi:hypothetical protein
MPVRAAHALFLLVLLSCLLDHLYVSMRVLALSSKPTLAGKGSRGWHILTSNLFLCAGCWVLGHCLCLISSTPLHLLPGAARYTLNPFTLDPFNPSMYTPALPQIFTDSQYNPSVTTM